MTEYPSILRLLEAERERYTLEAAELSRRLEFVHNQMKSLDTLISGYAIEEQMYSTPRRLYNVESTQAFIQDSLVDESESDSAVAESSLLTEVESNTPTLNQTIAQTSPLIPDSQSPTNHVESTVEDTVEPDISDIPKLTTPRKPGNIPLLPQFQEYSVQNAVCIRMLLSATSTGIYHHKSLRRQNRMLLQHYLSGQT
jgi:hypothetical protein